MRSPAFTTHDDICISRHRDNAASNAANKVANLSKSEVRAKVYSIAQSLGTFTSKDIKDLIHKPLNEFSGRLTELCDAGLIVQTSELRGRFHVYRVVKRDGQIPLF